MHRQSRLCRQCSFADPEWRTKLSLARRGKPSYERTPDSRAKMSQALKGKKKNYRPASLRPEVAEKIRASWTPERREDARQRGLRFAADPEWRRRIGESVSGARNPMYQHGNSVIPYAPGWGRVNRRELRAAAHNRCQNCGAKGLLDIHHLDQAKDNHSRQNLVVLCRKCHKALHYPRNTHRRNSGIQLHLS